MLQHGTKINKWILHTTCPLQYFRYDHYLFPVCEYGEDLWNVYSEVMQLSLSLWANVCSHNLVCHISNHSCISVMKSWYLWAFVNLWYLICVHLCSARMEQMKMRHMEDFPARAPLIPPPQSTVQPNTNTQKHMFKITSTCIWVAIVFCLK